MQDSRRRIRVPKEMKVRAELQKEIHSCCPLCPNNDVGHFHIHHIDSNPSNNEVRNLILLCPLCHSKITKGDISYDKVVAIKNDLINKLTGIEFVSVVVDAENCSWISTEKPNVFFNSGKQKSPFPILSFTLINHTNKTVVLKAIRVRTKNLPSGIYGLPQAGVLKSLIKYKLCISEGNQESIFQLAEQLQCPSSQGMKFDIELYQKIIDNEIVPPQGRMVLFFVFEFSSDMKIVAPTIHLNCTYENEPLVIYSCQ